METHWINAPEDITGFIGFVYCITHTESGKQYIGKKNFFESRTWKLKSGKRRRKIVESDWKTYTSSSRKLNEDIAKHGEKAFKFEMLYLCDTKGELNYMELHYQVMLNVLHAKNDKGEYRYYNEFIGGKFRR